MLAAYKSILAWVSGFVAFDTSPNQPVSVGTLYMQEPTTTAPRKYDQDRDMFREGEQEVLERSRNTNDEFA